MNQSQSQKAAQGGASQVSLSRAAALAAKRQAQAVAKARVAAMREARKRFNPRRHRHDDHDNQDRWLVSYADFITLLFAFFVVMYAMAMVSDGDMRTLSRSIVSAFSSRTIPGKPATEAQEQPQEPVDPLVKPAEDDQDRSEKRQAMRGMAGELQAVLASLVKEGKVRVIENNRGITVEINESLLFAPGEARLESNSIRALQRIARIIATTAYPVQVEGHTDTTPIATAQFPSNWELSASRASSVVRVFIDAGVSARRLTAVGFADQRPLESNARTESRARNRRVNIMIEAPNRDSISELPVPAALLPTGE